jgi:uncharacterized protein involved in exopolysaccharide biosynthesis
MFELRHKMQSAAIGTADPIGPVGFAPFAGIDFRKLWSVLWRRKAMIILATAASLVAALLLVLVVPHQFTAATQILIDPTNLRAVENELTPVKFACSAPTTYCAG